MGRRLGLRATFGALLLACGLSSAQANSDPHTIVFGVAPGPYGDMVKQATERKRLQSRGARIQRLRAAEYGAVERQY